MVEVLNGQAELLFDHDFKQSILVGGEGLDHGCEEWVLEPLGGVKRAEFFSLLLDVLADLRAFKIELPGAFFDLGERDGRGGERGQSGEGQGDGAKNDVDVGAFIDPVEGDGRGERQDGGIASNREKSVSVLARCVCLAAEQLAGAVTRLGDGVSGVGGGLRRARTVFIPVGDGGGSRPGG